MSRRAKKSRAEPPQFFDELGSRIERRWREKSYAEDVFPDIAAQALSETPPDQNVSPWDIIRWLFSAAHIPSQHDIPGTFGEPPIAVFNGPRFDIHVYFWLDGVTSIHQHSFSGAFQVLAGSSILSHYRFDCHQVINEHFMTGQMTLEGVELLEQGMIKRIQAGKKYIHSLFHLDRPSVTVCVRTHHTPSGSPQYNYVGPYFAMDPFFVDPLSVKQTQSAALLLSMQHPEAMEMIGELLVRSDFQTALAILERAQRHLSGNALENAFGITTGEGQYQALLEIARRRHGHLVDLIQPVLEETRRQTNLVLRRSQITSSEHRFFLALLLNVPSRELILNLVRQRFPHDDPIETVTNWVDELAQTRTWGSSEPNVLGIDHFDDDYLFVLECLLRGCSLEQTRLAVKEEFPERGEQQNEVAELYRTIRDSSLFRCMFDDNR